MGLFHFGKKKEQKSKHFDGNTTDPQKALEYLLHEAMHGCFEVEDIVEDDHIYLPKWQITIIPQIQQLTEQSAVLGFYIYCPHWGQRLYECCASVGKDPKQAMGMCVGSFLFAFMQGITMMNNKELPRPFETEYAGKSHRFQAYLSNIVGMGESPQTEGTELYWDLLKDDIMKRLGNQRFCYVKVYGSKINGEVIGECRIDDVQSDELSAKVAELVGKWDVQGFASHKQFFFIQQEPETTLPYPYWGEKGEKDFIGKVLKAIQLFHGSDTQEAFDTLEERLIATLGDATLATECRLFLPEICAEHAFGEQMQFSETIDLLPAGGERITLYKHQLMDYYTLQNTLFTAFDQNIFGEETNTIYQELVGTSAIYDVISQMQEKGTQLKDCKLTGLLFNVGEDFELR